jgi:hypothetical protein
MLTNDAQFGAEEGGFYGKGVFLVPDDRGERVLAVSTDIK